MNRGVNVGWRILQIQGEEVYGLRDISTRLRRLKSDGKSKDPIAVAFTPGIATSALTPSFTSPIVPTPSNRSSQRKGVSYDVSAATETDAGSVALSVTTTESGYGRKRTTVCDVCGLRFLSRSEFRRHAEKHKEAPVVSYSHKCSVCHQSFASLEYFERHKCSDYNTTCPHCGTKLASMESLRYHLVAWEANGRMCEKTFNQLLQSAQKEVIIDISHRNLTKQEMETKQRLKKRDEILAKYDHGIEPPRGLKEFDIEFFPCINCTNIFDTLRDYKRHEAKCRRQTTAKLKAEASRRMRRNKTRIKLQLNCPYCGRTYSSQGKLLGHSMEEHYEQTMEEITRRREEVKRSIEEKEQIENAQRIEDNFVADYIAKFNPLQPGTPMTQN
ncbi:hypothetical protein AAMO2058_000781400 [Amorphochlora amoebiformis]